MNIWLSCKHKSNFTPNKLKSTVHQKWNKVNLQQKRVFHTDSTIKFFFIYLLIYLLVRVICKYSMVSLFLYFACIFELFLCMCFVIFFFLVISSVLLLFLFSSVPHPTPTVRTPHPAPRTPTQHFRTNRHVAALLSSRRIKSCFFCASKLVLKFFTTRLDVQNVLISCKIVAAWKRSIKTTSGSITTFTFYLPQIDPHESDTRMKT